MCESIFPAYLWDDTLPETYEKYKSILVCFREIITLLYSPQSLRSAALTCSLYTKSFLLHSLLSDAFPPEDYPSLYSLPLHQLITHLPELSRRFFCVDLTTETFEAIWRPIRAIEARKSNHRGDIVGSWLLNLYFQGVRAERFGHTTPGLEIVAQGSYIHSIAKVLKSFCIPAAYSGSEIPTEDCSVLLWNIADFHLGIWYEFLEDGALIFLRNTHLITDLTLPLHNHDASLHRERLAFAFDGNPVKSKISSQSELDRDLATDCLRPDLEPEMLKKQECIFVCDLRRKHVSADDWRKDLLSSISKADFLSCHSASKDTGGQCSHSLS